MTHRDDPADDDRAPERSGRPEASVAALDEELRRALDDLRHEPAPERLLELARELQRLLRSMDNGD